MIGTIKKEISHMGLAVWAQRKNDVFVTVNISNATDVVVDIAPFEVLKRPFSINSITE